MEGLNYYEGNKKNVVIPEGTRAIVVEGFHDEGLKEGISPDLTRCFKTTDLKDVETIDMPDSVELIEQEHFNAVQN